MEASRATVGMSSAGKVDGAGRQLRSRRMFSYAEKACARLCRLPPAASSQIDTGALDDPVDMLAASSTSGPKRQEPMASAPPAKKVKGKAAKSKQPALSAREQLVVGYGPGVVHFLEDDEPLSGAASAPIGKHQFLVDRIWRANMDGLEEMFRVKWLGWKSPEGDTVVAESGIFPDLVELFRECEKVGKPFPSYLERLVGKVKASDLPPESELEPMRVTDEPAVGEDLFRIPEVDMLALLKESACANNVKAQQSGEPKGGYRAHVGGIIAANSSDNLCLDWDWFRNSESISASLYFMARLFQGAPALLDEVQVITQDDACHFKKTLQAQLRRLEQDRNGAPDTPAMALFRKMLSKAIVVDRFHFRNHKGKTGEDEYCARETNPDLEWIPVGLNGDEKVELQRLMEGENSESSEQLFRWMGRLRFIINEMAISRATFYVHRMVWQHNIRTIIEQCMETMKREDVRRVRAAYRMPACERIGPVERRELADLLLAGLREYDLQSQEYLTWQAKYEAKEAS